MPTITIHRRLTANGSYPVLTLPKYIVKALGWEPKKTELLISLTEEGLNVRRYEEPITPGGETEQKRP